MTCDKCGAVLEIGAWPFCPHERGASFNVQPDSIPGGQVFENGLAVPTRFYSHSEHVKALDAAGLQIAPRYVENSKTMTRWDTVNLEAARVLVTRGASPRMAGKQVLAPHPDYPITVTDAGWKVKP